MSPVVLHDGNRSGHLTWAESALVAGTAVGMVISPFCTPRETIPRHGRTPAQLGAVASADRIRLQGGQVFLDPTTHGVFVPGADAFAAYDTWDLWPSGARGAATAQALEGHVDLVVARAAELELPLITPTLPLDSATGPFAEQAFRMAERAIELAPGAHIAVVGSAGFWSGGNALDAYIGELIQLRPAGWAVTVMRDALRYPWPGLDPAEVAGLCRSAHSLSLRDAPVVVCHGDLSALPAIAAGATHVGSGWDLRQRVCAYDSFRITTGVRRASPRVTHEGLVASLKRPEAEALATADGALSTRLVAGPLPPDQNSHWRHHLRVLNDRVDHVVGAGTRDARVARLQQLYSVAGAAFDQVVAVAGRLEAGRAQWIDPLASGVDLYAVGEGW